MSTDITQTNEAVQEMVHNNLDALMGAAGQAGSLGYSLLDTIWAGANVILALVLVAVVWGWWADVAEEESQRSLFYLAAAVIAVIVSVFSCWVNLLNGFIFPYLLVIAYVYMQQMESMKKAGIYGFIFFFCAIMIGTLIAPGFFDFMGYFNWRSWLEVYHGASWGSVARESMWGNMDDLQKIWDQLMGSAGGLVP
ncbi:MAG: hypothetical protein DRI48_00495 [Chloroflexi bacterium]|nr:MAG: hypothetical protein DRI48_00495 [Chloroflexota bacterium]